MWTGIRLAFAGASGTGKSTLAEYVAHRYGLPICPIGSRSVAEEMGFSSPYAVDDAGKRAEFQKRLLEMKLEWEASHDSFVTDRTHMDNVAYASLHAIDIVTSSYIKRAAEGMQRYTHVIVCPISAFQDLGDDPQRRQGDAGYHVIFDALLDSLIGMYAPITSIAWSRELDARKRLVDSCF